jgi:signal transduction histidine kinase/CheY-like chemotaxis protein
MRVLLLLALAIQLLVFPAHAQSAASQIAIGQGQAADLLPGALLFRDEGGAFPASAAALPAWTATLKKAARVESAGGSYWMVASIRNPTNQTRWVVYPDNSVIEIAEILVLGADGSKQHVTTGYQAHHDYLLHYGSDVTLAAHGNYLVVMRFSGQYFVRTPMVSIHPQAAFRKLVAREAFLIMASLGALAALAIVNLFIFSFTRNRASLYYTLYLVTYALAWAMPFNVLADLFDWHETRLHYVPWFLLPVFSTLFYLHFLRLKEIAPRLASISGINLVLPLLLLPTSFFALGLAHKLATLVIMIWMVLALVSGIVAWKRGFKPARYFVFGYVALMAPALLVVPANLGLMHALQVNMQLVTLMGGTLDALLLAFALADQIRLLSTGMEQNVARRTQELVHANAALTIAKEHAEVVSRHRIDFLSAMSHDIRTPLAGVIGMLKLGLRDTVVQGRTAEYLRIGLRNGESLLVILNDILDFSKIDAGKLTLELTSFPLASLVADAVGILQGQADLKGLSLRVGLDPALPQFVEGDPTRIRQILVNLVGNAIKFTERGEVLLAVSAGAPDGATTPVTFAVTDTGPGIPAEVQARLFQKFEQADHSTTRRYGGTGLGLAICKELVGLMGGAISVDSRPGEGSRFAFTLPMAAGGAPLLAQADKAPERHAYQLRILCAEDVRTNQIIIGALLESMGHQVRVVENGVEALQALRDADFDMVMMDGRMPLMDGEQATRAIRTGGTVRDPGIPIIALTANASSVDSARCLAAGMDGFLSKPVDDAKLYDVIESTIDVLRAGGRQLRPAAAAAPVHVVAQPGLSAAHIARIAQAFLAEGPRRLAQARSAIGAGDAAGAADALHALRGSAGYLSSPRLRDLAGALEDMANGGRLAQAGRDFGELERAMAQALGDLQPAAEASATL